MTQLCSKHLCFPSQKLCKRFENENARRGSTISYQLELAHAQDRWLNYRSFFIKSGRWVHFAYLYRRNALQKLSRLNTFKPRKTPISSALLTRYRFQMYRGESGMQSFNGGSLKNTLTVPLK